MSMCAFSTWHVQNLNTAKAWNRSEAGHFAHRYPGI
ncbi:hypothetical protein YSA_10878 [Pseudomonas putida ND6]|uniref:Uncharacterized protein n=1 Tax=Pseudomonas putida ND6 TaxID=231023 RepID=I3V4J8_PSEPU|nr:hypothetical protein YSA_10878 [Pseudomonas putida ND6]